MNANRNKGSRHSSFQVSDLTNVFCFCFLGSGEWTSLKHRKSICYKLYLCASSVNIIALGILLSGEWVDLF